MHIDAHRTPWTLSGLGGMRRLRTTLVVCALSIGLTACSTKPRTVREVVTVFCPQEAPARLCPMTLDRPKTPNILQVMMYAEHLEEVAICWQRRDGDWQQLMLDCRTVH